MDGQTASAASWRLWLERTLRRPGFAAALEQASPVLARRVWQICEGGPVPERAVRRAVLAVMRYLLRASGRATPFGLFAGVTPARITRESAASELSVRVGGRHRAIARVDATWLAAVVEGLEAEPALRPHLTVQANALVVEKDGHLVLEHRASGSSGGPPTNVRVASSRPVNAAMAAARDPILMRDLADTLAADFPGVPADVIDKLLADLVAQHFLVTGLRAAMTTTDPLGHLLAALDTAAAAQIAEVAGPVAQLREIADGLVRHNTASAPAAASRQRARLIAAMRDLGSAAEPALAVDLRLDWDVVLPRTVVDEVARAAAMLVRLAPRPTLSPGWVTWHGRFLERYGPRALVPVLDVVDADIGLGYPPGYLGGPASHGDGGPTGRDQTLLALAQKAALYRQREIVLDEATVAELEAAAPHARVQPTTELTVRVHAASAQALTNGQFTLSVVGVSRAAGTTTGRFLDLFSTGDRQRMRKAYENLPTVTQDALLVQIAAPPLYASTENVSRVPRVLPQILTLGACHGREQDQIALEDVAVAADANRLYLVSLSKRRPLEFVTFNAVEPVNQTHPLIRFLTEVTNAMSVPCGPFDWGAAAGLPFLPAVRYGRTILSPARWLLTADDLPGVDADHHQWSRALAAWRDHVAAPAVVHLGDGDQRIPLDLSEPSHRTLLRAELERAGTVLLRAAPDDDAAEWINGHAHEIVVPLATSSTAPAPLWLRDGQPVGRDRVHLPGCGGRFLLKLYSHRDRHSSILIRHLPRLLGELNDCLGEQGRCWFLRYRDPEDHLRLRLTVPAHRVAPAAAAIGAWSRSLRQVGVINRVQWDTDFPETARFGGGTATDAAEAYFAADSAAAVAQLAAGAAKDGPDARALTAASMLDIAIGLIGDPPEAMNWLIRHTTTASEAPPRTLYDQAVALANPNDHRHLAGQPNGDRIIGEWARRHQALAAYRAVLVRANTDHIRLLLPDLLHLHHTRMAGPDAQGERLCLHLARAAALSWTTRAKEEA
ncbi:hypothetical protein Acsp04_62980 [Actinomadura sp. NBRC 104425]|nr:hypothetical protein Acsp04_62980 [Actinomadura sp. NBRC 104425]